MRCTIPEISWHNREPVLSVDIHPVCNDFFRLASGGGDGHILIWQMTVSENGAVKQEVITDLTRHQKAVNTVRWSPSGSYLASADDDANIIVWQLKTDNIPSLEGESEDKESWVVYKVLRGHKEDIYDMCWSVDSKKLLSGSVDNTAILWDLSKAKIEHILTDHKGFVQGVAWDPKSQFLATIGTDRICRLFDISGKHVKARIHKGKLPVPPNHFLFDKENKYFHDDTFKSFFRRLEFSPDGSLLVVPSGHVQAEDCKKILNATLVFTMDNFVEPAAVLPLAPHQCSTTVRFCPGRFALRPAGPPPYVGLPYRLIFAVGTDHDVVLYDTQQRAPFARFHQIHYTRSTDLAWAPDGTMLVAASTDGFCALITFEAGELGVPYAKEESDAEETPTETIPTDPTDKDENIDINNKAVQEVAAVAAAAHKKRPSFLKQWAQNNFKKPEAKKTTGEIIEISDDDDEEEEEEAENPRELSRGIREQINRLIPRRIEQVEVDDGRKATPIEVRRAPRIVGAQPIAVRRKPREPENERRSTETGGSKVTFGDLKVTSGDSKVTSGDSKVTSGDLKVTSSDSKKKPVDPNMTLVDPKVTSGDSKKKPVDPKMTHVDSEMTLVDLKVTLVDSKMTLFDPEVTLDDSEMTLVDSKKKPVDPKVTPVDSEMTPVDSKKKPVGPQMTLVDSKMTPVDSKMTPVDPKLTPVDSEMTPVDPKGTLVGRKMTLVDPKVTLVDPKVTLVDSRANTENCKAPPIDDRKNLVVVISENEQKQTDAKETEPALIGDTPTSASKRASSSSSSTKRKKPPAAAPPKVRVGSLVRRKLGAAPSAPKSNPLLNFLQRRTRVGGPSSSVAAAAEEESARDGWEGGDGGVAEVGGAGKGVAEGEEEEERTEDFCLRLEDSQEGEAGKEVVVEEEVRKAPRRVALITLSSPKGARGQKRKIDDT